MPKKKLATISILLPDRQKQADKLQKIFTREGHLITARLGINVQPVCIAHCTGLINLVVEGEASKIKLLEQEIKSVSGVVVKLVKF
ncbi:MAG: hypothetical protein PHT51_01575 [Patescibacteria group bacterium]|nr:hypothetical protein [Patescibacteria group bacterium]MDD4611098.1 hypothetical protein [Patescibacteria group bacterium]